MAARNMEIVLLIHCRAGTLDVNRREQLRPLINLGHDAPREGDPTEGEDKCQARYHC
jgi:hypothetical protein